MSEDKGSKRPAPPKPAGSPEAAQVRRPPPRPPGTPGTPLKKGIG